MAQTNLNTVRKLVLNFIRWRERSVQFEGHSAIPAEFRPLINNATEPLPPPAGEKLPFLVHACGSRTLRLAAILSEAGTQLCWGCESQSKLFEPILINDENDENDYLHQDPIIKKPFMEILLLNKHKFVIFVNFNLFPIGNSSTLLSLAALPVCHP